MIHLIVHSFSFPEERGPGNEPASLERDQTTKLRSEEEFSQSPLSPGNI